MRMFDVLDLDDEWDKAFTSWMSDDLCFRALVYVDIAVSASTYDLGASLMQTANAHVAACGRCLARMDEVAAATTDARKAQSYLVMRQLSELHLGRVTFSDEPDGQHERMQFVPERAWPCMAVDKHWTRDPAEPLRIVYDVASEAIWDDPFPVTESFDAEAVEMVQRRGMYTNADPWMAVHRRQVMPVYLRWNGQTKLFAPGLSLDERYRGMMIANEAVHRQKYGTLGLVADNRADYVERMIFLLDRARRYTGRASFAGYIKVAWSRELIDVDRSRRRGGLDRVDERAQYAPAADRLTADDRLGGDGGGSSPRKVPEAVEQFMAQRTVHQLLSQLKPSLSAMEQQVLDLVVEGLNDRKIAARVGRSREQVNRIKRRLLERAREIGRGAPGS